MSQTKIHPVAGYILVQPQKQEKTTASGIVLPDNHQDKPQQGKVISVGDPIFFYLGNKTQSNFINYGTITDIQTDPSAETAYFINDTKVSYSDVIGKGNGSIVYHNAGLILSILDLDVSM